MTHNSRFRFSISTLMFAIASLAVSLALLQWYLMVRNSKPIGTVIHQFNTDVYNKHGKVAFSNPPLTTDQILEFLDSDDKYLNDAPPHYASIFRRISRTHRIPNNATFELNPMGTSEDGTLLFSVALEVTEGYQGYTLIVYEPPWPE